VVAGAPATMEYEGMSVEDVASGKSAGRSFPATKGAADATGSGALGVGFLLLFFFLVFFLFIEAAEMATQQQQPKSKRTIHIQSCK